MLSISDVAAVKLYAFIAHFAGASALARPVKEGFCYENPQKHQLPMRK
jgi:hypothetical protein